MSIPTWGLLVMLGGTIVGLVMLSRELYARAK